MGSTLVLARHARTSWNAMGRIQGHQGDGIDSHGRRQAQKLGHELKQQKLTIETVFASDLLRAQQTAWIIADILKIDVTTDKRLRECSLGSLEGYTHEEVIANHGPRMVSHLEARGFPYDFRPFDGECEQQVVKRHTEMICEVHRLMNGRPILLVGHGRSLNSFLMKYFSHVEALHHNCEYRVIHL